MAASETERETVSRPDSSDSSANEAEASRRLLESSPADASKPSSSDQNDVRQSGRNSTLPELTVAQSDGARGADKNGSGKKQSELDAAGKILSGLNSSAGEIRTMCNKNISDLVSKINPGASENLLKHSAVITSLANAERVGGKQLLQDVIDATNSNLWLDGSKNRLRQNPIDPANPQERRVDIYNKDTNKTIHSMNFSVLPESARSDENRDSKKGESKESESKESQKVLKFRPAARRYYK